MRQLLEENETSVWSRKDVQTLPKTSRGFAHSGSIYKYFPQLDY